MAVSSSAPGGSSEQLPPRTPNELLDKFTRYTMGKLSELICEIPGGTADDRVGLATAVMGEILARTLSVPDAEWGQKS